MQPVKIKYFETPAAFRAWLGAHHASANELWVGYYKKSSGRRSMSWAESVDEALCYGWENRSGVDSFEQRASELEEKYARVFRRHRAAWSFYQSQPPGYRRTANWWVVSAKQEATRLARLEKLIAHCAAGKRLPQFTSPGRKT